MSDLNIDDPGSAESRSYSLPSPLMIAAVCTLAVVTLFIAVLDAEGQTIERPMAAVAPEVKFGSLRGSITNDERKAIGGVRVLIRRVHAGAANFHFDRVTAADGTFEVRSLLPG
ncbi:MAG TPA: hypothetical protein VL501_00555, partial [Pyrinomonadaceae bacterium]|nr:hypothetical protein [Pyrinomonadaceae bacterium]